MTVLKVQNLSVNFGKATVVSNAAFKAAAGELIGVIGPNGAGKTSLMRACLGFIPALGEVKLSGTPLNELSVHERAKRASFLPQQRTVHWALSVENIIALGRQPYRSGFAGLTAEDKELITQAMIYMDVQHLRDRSVKDLSGGELARVLIARSLAQNTPLLLADEPTAGLDPAHQISLMQTFSNLANQGSTILVSLHDLALAGRWCQRLLVLDKGKIIADGRPEQVLNAERLSDVYGVSARIIHDETGLMIVPIDLSQ